MTASLNTATAKWNYVRPLRRVAAGVPARGPGRAVGREVAGRGPAGGAPRGAALPRRWRGRLGFLRNDRRAGRDQRRRRDRARRGRRRGSGAHSRQLDLPHGAVAHPGVRQHLGAVSRCLGGRHVHPGGRADRHRQYPPVVGGAVRERRRRSGQSRGQEVYAYLDGLAEAIPAGSEGLLALDYFQGNRTPHKDPLARGTVVGLTLKHTLAHLYRAVVEGICFGTRQILDDMATHGFALERIVAGGGGAKSRLWTQIQADVLGRPIHLPRDKETMALGAAIWAGLGAGVFKTYQDAIDAHGPHRAGGGARPGAARRLRHALPRVRGSIRRSRDDAQTGEDDGIAPSAKRIAQKAKGKEESKSAERKGSVRHGLCVMRQRCSTADSTIHYEGGDDAETQDRNPDLLGRAEVCPRPAVQDEQGLPGQAGQGPGEDRRDRLRSVRDHLDAGAGPIRGEEAGGGRGGGHDSQLRHLGLPAPAGHRHRVRTGPVPLPLQREPPGAGSGGHAGGGGQPEPDRGRSMGGSPGTWRIRRSSGR